MAVKMVLLFFSIIKYVARINNDDDDDDDVAQPASEPKGVATVRLPVKLCH